MSAGEGERIEQVLLDEGERPRLNLRVGQVIDDVYTILDKHQPDVVSTSETDRAAESLGAGGSGTVYVASYRRLQKRAIKFLTLNFLSDATGKGSRDFQTTFNRERVFLARLAHGNIARFYDTGSYTDNNGIEWQYLVTDYIDGSELMPTLENPETAPEQAYDLIRDVLRTVVYMHGMGVLHADLKTQNIMCRQLASGPEAVILDLGTAHYVKSQDQHGQPELPLDKQARVRFISTSSICHDQHQRYRGRPVDDDIMRVLFPSHDLHALGILFQQMGNSDQITTKLRQIIGREGLTALDTMSYNLRKAPEPESSSASDPRRVLKYDNAVQVYEDWKKLRRTYLAPVGVPELSLAAEFKYSVATSAGRSVITPRLNPIINHKLFQRLRRVPQLEMTYMSFPGATHTRFAHSLAVLRNTRYYLAHLLNDPNFRLLTERSDLEATILLALLHDVGHYQLSHMFEDLASSQRGAEDEHPWNSIDFDIPTDDDLFWDVIEPEGKSSLRGNYGQHIEAAWRESEDELGINAAPTLAEIIGNEFDPDTYVAMRQIHDAIYRPNAARNPKPAHLVLGAVLSSDVDADKVAYLVEDAARSGVKYGDGVDFDGLLGSLRMPAIGDLQGRPTLGITQKGVAAAQSITVSRNLMVGQVYWRHTNRAATAMIRYVISRLLQVGSLPLSEYVGQTFFSEYDTALRVLFRRFKELNTGDTEVNPIAGLLDGERRIYKPAFSTSRLDRDTSERIGDKLANKRYDDVLFLQRRVLEIVREASDLTDIKDGEVLVDVPLKGRDKPGGDRGGQVYVYSTRSDPAGVPLRGFTPFLEEVKRQHVRENRISRVFVAPRIAEAGKYEEVMKHVRKYMTEMYGS